MKRTLRIAARNYHVWFGLSAGLLFSLMGLSGSIILYRTEIEAALRPSWKAASQARPLPALADADANVRHRWPDAMRNRVSFPQTPGEPYVFMIRTQGRERHVYCDAQTGEILGTFDLPWLDWIASFHQNLLLPGTGRPWIGIIGIVLFTCSLAGVSLWLLRNPNWRGIFRIGWRASWNRLSFDLHRSTGLIASAFLLVLSFTGICLAYPDTFQSLVETVAGSPAARPARIKLAESGMNQPLDSYVQAALGAVPGGGVRELRYPQSAHRPVIVRLWRPGDFRREGSNYVTLDPASARVLGVDAIATWSIARRVAASAAPIHYAEWGGAAVKLLWCLAGIMPAFLFVSGVLFWTTGFRARRNRATGTRIEERGAVLAHR
jgi:uncharacterized iron-regulated membrane protein